MLPINVLAVLVCGVAAMVLGFLWYGPFFGAVWAKGMGWEMTKENTEQMKKMAGPAYLQQFIGALLMAWVLATIMSAFFAAVPMAPWMGAINAGFFSWLGFVLPVKYGDRLWGKRPWSVIFIDQSYYLVTLLAMSFIIAYWR